VGRAEELVGLADRRTRGQSSRRRFAKPPREPFDDAAWQSSTSRHWRCRLASSTRLTQGRFDGPRPASGCHQFQGILGPAHPSPNGSNPVGDAICSERSSSPRPRDSALAALPAHVRANACRGRPSQRRQPRRPVRGERGEAP
jgi:hypothetical protein